jgi:alkylation response protein AidB-like acyl-CoA dehydrogenase
MAVTTASDEARSSGSADLLARARALAPLIEGDAPVAEERGTLTPGVVDALAAADLFWLLVPRQLGGLESDLVTALDVFEELARADGSTGWSLMANATASCFGAIYTGDEAARAMFVDQGRGIHAGMFAPVGTGRRDGDGYLVTGRYQFGSGSGHANWFSGGFQEVDGDGEPMVTESGMPAMRVVFLPHAEVDLRGNWDVMGLAATGSYDYVVDSRHVDDDFTFALLEAEPRRGGPVYGVGLFTLTALGHAGFALGVGRRALDEVLAIARAGKERLGADRIADQQLFQHDFALHDAALRGARAYTVEAFAGAEAAAVTDGRPSPLQEQRTRQATTHATRVAADAARFAYTWAGSAGLRNPSVVGRCFRDVHAGTQHLFVDNNTLTGYTQALLAG